MKLDPSGSKKSNACLNFLKKWGCQQKKVKKKKKNLLLFRRPVLFFNHEKEILHQHRNPRIRRADRSRLHVRQPWLASVQRLDGQGFLRGQIPQDRTLCLAKENCQKIV